MRIIIIGRFYPEAFASFIEEGLAALGHEVIRLELGPKSAPEGTRIRFYLNRLSSKAHEEGKKLRGVLGLGAESVAIRRCVERAGSADLTLCTHDYLTPVDAALVKQLTKAPLALWYPDPIWSFQRHMFLNGGYDLLFFKDPYIVDLLRRKIEAPAYYLPECFSPASLGGGSYDERSESRFSTDVCTAGNLYAYRVAFWNKLADFDAKIWGLPAPLWMDLGLVKPLVQNQWVGYETKALAFRFAKIVLNNLNPAEIWGTNVRTFEICGAGGFQLVDWRPGLSQLFNIGEELVAFDTMADLRAKIRHYLQSDDERASIAERGQRRARRDHTYELRLKLLIDTVMGRAQGYPMPLVQYKES